MITFDFDETLTMPTWNARYELLEPSENPNHAAIDKLLKYRQQGEELAIVTTRWRDEEILEFIHRYRLPVSKVCLTEGELKYSTLHKLGCKLHFDDSEEEAVANLKHNIPTVLVDFEFSTTKNRVICNFKQFIQAVTIISR